jgi:hypothetical protein
LARVLGQLKPNGPTGLPLPDVRRVDGVAIRCHVINAERNEIAAAQLASMARLNNARSRVRFSSCSLARIAQT